MLRENDDGSGVRQLATINIRSTVLLGFFKALQVGCEICSMSSTYATPPCLCFLSPFTAMLVYYTTEYQACIIVD
ncbi:unnamed protein product [Gongylonema pulchrum]|uniref:Ovule protein n=1 Tax=Gongylonema pulchrum TaxID=637853 RepID=A0A183EAQ8_9BILA|nr:unnamed protein product [Gongylonema pulchrum]